VDKKMNLKSKMIACATIGTVFVLALLVSAGAGFTYGTTQVAAGPVPTGCTSIAQAVAAGPVPTGNTNVAVAAGPVPTGCTSLAGDLIAA
jgi:hypothetical protein